ncbi:SRPBCC family protein [Nocardia jiangxiensis]|uniref:SRPBCC family protein n=1 Tax=Nocardia jiangxiensis TaxID=282685 RepID=A0ABW6S198_9NOCA|nr:SRPBCC family protein [Nocardia jiangxiensis]
MSNSIAESTTIKATAEKVRSAILDVEAYPTWQKEMLKVEIVDKDALGRPATVKFDISAMGQKASYTLVYSYPDETTIETHLTEGDTIVKQDQTYGITSVAAGVELNYQLDMAVKWSVPDFMLKAIINKGIKGTLTGIKTRSEG